VEGATALAGASPAQTWLPWALALAQRTMAAGQAAAAAMVGQQAAITASPVTRTAAAAAVAEAGLQSVAGAAAGSAAQHMAGTPPSIEWQVAVVGGRSGVGGVQSLLLLFCVLGCGCTCWRRLRAFKSFKNLWPTGVIDLRLTLRCSRKFGGWCR
jgi:hypothetical protein